jgi:hypothetical protein
MKKHRLLIAGTILCGVAAGSTARAAVCGINFDDYIALKRINFSSSDPTHANKTSTIDNGRCPDFVRTFPDSRMSHPSCRMYEQSCGAGTKVFAWDQSSYQHYHLDFEDPSYSGVNTGCFPGYHKVNGTCLRPADLATLPRFFHAMDGSNWTEIGRTDDGVSSLYPFGIYSVDVKSIPIQLWFKRTDGSVAGWSSLPQGNWLLDVPDVVAVWISSASGGTEPYELWDFAVTVP